MPNAHPPPSDWREQLTQLGRIQKRNILFAVDFVILAFSLWASYSLRLNTLYVPPTPTFTLILLMAPLIGVAALWRLGAYRLVTRYIDPSGARRITLAIFAGTMAWIAFEQMTGSQEILPRTSIILYIVLSLGLMFLSRTLIGWVLKGSGPASLAGTRKGVIIYGAGPVGVQLQQELRRTPEYCPIAFVDESADLHAQKINGIKVYPPADLERLVARGNVVEILMADPALPRRRVQHLAERFAHVGVAVRRLPTMEDIASGRVSVTDLRDIDAKALLGRPSVEVDARLLDEAVHRRNILVTGAGGSIGSELVRQIAWMAPRTLVLYEVSEAALYLIEKEIRELLLLTIGPETVAPRVVGVLGTVTDDGAIRRVITQYRVETIFHAAAYKHVPIVESNPAAGIRNNAFGTRVVAEAARDLGVERFVLISTDKAVRPTNIMGASKRLAELVLQALASEPGTRTVFTMVRFGNVLNSSGSVAKLFREQIRSGGPVTVTHKDITRYFMSIPEAAELVIQAGAMAGGGEVFVLDMGEPVRIDDLARKMIRLMGRSVRDDANPDGDIAIVHTGLRPGEKLYEELQIGANLTRTPHPRINRCIEPALTPAELAREFDALQAVLLLDDMTALQAVLTRNVEGYQPQHLPLLGTTAPDEASTRH